jgi:predicted ribosome quality control (RQC) complex YloA/Tae2 family protein
MPKARFTVSDVAAMAREVRERCGDWRVNQIYDGDARTFVLKLQQSGIAEKRLLLLESGTKFLVTKFDAREDPTTMPSPLCSKLRSSLKGKRLTDVKALGRDRVVSLRFGAGPGTFNLFLELYGAGNVVLCDASYVVVAALRTDSLKVGESYNVAVRAVAPVSELLPADSLQKFLEDALRTRVERSEAAALAQQTKKKKKRRGAWTLAQLLLDRGSGVDAYGSDVVDHCIVASGLDGSLPLAEQPEDYVHKLHAALRAAPSLADAISSGTCGTPRLLLENDKFVSFAPGVFLQHECYQVREFSSFCEAVDEYFRETKETKLQSKARDATTAITAKVEKIRIDQKQRVDDLEASLAQKERTASLLEERADQIDAVVQVLNNALQSGLRWDEVQDYVREEQAKGSPLASLIQDIDFEQRVVTVVLDECTASVSLDESARAASSTLWSLAKKARMKVAKTQEASVSVIKAAEKQADNKLKARAWQQDASRLKKQKSTQAWFQRFAWFVSSEGYLIVAPRDKGQCEQVVFGGVLRPTDALVICEQNGPPTVVRARNGVLSPLALHEAGCFAACRSDAWQRRDRAPAYWVPGFSVRKVGSSNSSQVLDVLGDVAISTGTKKTYLPPTQLELTFALLFKLSEDSVEAHSNDRVSRVPDEELLRLTPSEEDATTEEEIEPVAVEDALPPAPEPHFARTGLCGHRRAYRPRGQCRVDGVESPRHRADAATCGARNLISTQVPANSRQGSASSSRSLAVISTPCAKPNKDVLVLEQERVGGRRRPSLCR